MADNQFVEGVLFAIAGFVSDVLIKALFFSGNFGTDYGWLFILIGVILVIGSLAEAITVVDSKGCCFAVGYLIGLLLIH